MSNALVSQMAAFEHGLEDAGWTAGKNLQIDIRWGGGALNRYRQYVRLTQNGRLEKRPNHCVALSDDLGGEQTFRRPSAGLRITSQTPFNVLSSST